MLPHAHDYHTYIKRSAALSSRHRSEIPLIHVLKHPCDSPNEAQQSSDHSALHALQKISRRSSGRSENPSGNQRQEAEPWKQAAISSHSYFTRENRTGKRLYPFSQVLSGKGLGRCLSQKGGRPSAPTARCEFSGEPGKPKNPGTLIYGSRIRVRIGGSSRVQAQPARPSRVPSCRCTARSSGP